MKRHCKYSLLTVWMLAALPLQAQQFTTTGSASTATLENPVYNNVFVKPTLSSRPMASKPAGTAFGTPTQGQVFSTNAFTSRRRSSSFSGTLMAGSGYVAGNYSGFTNISAYQNISSENIGLTSPRRGGTPPPPPTPDPNDDPEPHVLPIGDAWWLLMFMAIAYALTHLFRRKQNA